MQISRRRLFGFVVGGLTLSPFVKPVRDTRWTDEETEEEAKRWEVPFEKMKVR